jgi:hypothetical protein
MKNELVVADSVHAISQLKFDWYEEIPEIGSQKPTE